MSAICLAESEREHAGEAHSGVIKKQDQALELWLTFQPYSHPKSKKVPSFAVTSIMNGSHLERDTIRLPRQETPPYARLTGDGFHVYSL